MDRLNNITIIVCVGSGVFWASILGSIYYVAELFKKNRKRGK